MRIGAMEVIPVNDGHMLAAVKFSKPLPPVASTQPHCAMFPADGRLSCRIGSFIVRSGERVLLIDAGAGDVHVCAGDHCVHDRVTTLLQQRGQSDTEIAAQMERFSKVELHTGTLPQDLALAGVRPEDITDVVLTHLHFDHVGWSSVDGRPTFPNATYRAPRADLDHFDGSSPHEKLNAALFGCPVVKDTLAPVFDRLEPWDHDTTIAPGVLVRVVPGHTPGNSIVVLHSQDQRAMLLGDVVHCPLELMDDEFNLIGDFDQKLADHVRESISREIEGTSTVVSAPHFPGALFGRLLAGKGLRDWEVIQ